MLSNKESLEKAQNLPFGYHSELKRIKETKYSLRAGVVSMFQQRARSLSCSFQFGLMNLLIIP